MLFFGGGCNIMHVNKSIVPIVKHFECCDTCSE